MNETEKTVINPKKVLFLSIITWGLYDFFWFLKNWKAVKEKENSRISPTGRSLFAAFYCYSFFKKTINQAHNFGFIEKYSAKKLAISYFVLTFIGMILGKTIPNMGWWGLLFSVIGLLGAWPLFEIQKVINYNSEQESGVTNLETGYTFGEVALVVFGILYSIYIITGPFFAQSISLPSLDSGSFY